MFGAYRCYLALVVVVIHAVRSDLLPLVGPISVFGFYLLSGFVISRVIDRSYHNGARGFAGFLANRALRLYPSYWVFFLLTIAIYFVTPGGLIPTQPLPIIINVSMMSLFESPLFYSIPVVWSIDVEILYYLAMISLLARGRMQVTAWWAGSLAYTAYLLWQGTVWGDVYFSYPGPTLCFSTGAMIYHYSRQIHSGVAWLRYWAVPLGLVLPFSFALTRNRSPAALSALDETSFLFLATAGMALAVARMSTLRAGRTENVLSRWDAFLGELSYPVFLSHRAMIHLARHWLGGDPPDPWTVAAITVPATLLVSVIAVYLVERPVQTYRNRVRAWTRSA